MKEKESALYSQYIIDGIRCDATPAELLEECMEFPDGCDEDSAEFDEIIDESTEPPLSALTFDVSKTDDYVRIISENCTSERPFSMLYPDHFTRLQIAQALLNRLWSEGHFRLYNLRLWAQWEWNTRPLGNMASFYKSVEASSDYIFGLGVKMSDYIFIESDDRCSAKFFAWLPDDDITTKNDTDLCSVPDTETALFKAPFESNHPWIGNKRKCPATALPDPNSWIIYIPFDTSKFRLGGSLLAQSNGLNGGQEPHITDPDYFIDCYEVIRELTEDGIIKAGCTVGDGGLAAAAEKMFTDTGLKIDISGIKSSYGEPQDANILFGEVPGVLIQINEGDFDYLDSQLILQDVAYYPVGRPTTDFKGLRFAEKSRKGIADILAGLLEQATEGED
jgi:phosphoribosylformylglycinamidine synthase